MGAADPTWRVGTYGSPAVGEPTSVRDYSEISLQLDFDFERLLSEAVGKVTRDIFVDKDDLCVFPASISFLIAESSQEIGQMPPGPSLQVRAGTKLEDRIYFSTAFLNSDEHIAWLEALNAELGSG